MLDWYYSTLLGKGMPRIPDVSALVKNGLKVIFSFHFVDPDDLSTFCITLKASNSNSTPLTEFDLKADLDVQVHCDTNKSSPM